MPSKMSGKCVVCDTPAELKCSECQAVHYCSRDHQKQHWKAHKYACSPYRIKEDASVGRYLQAIRDIKSGDVVLKEKPFIVGPAQVTPPVCLGCYKQLDQDVVVKCELCGWPFCSLQCTKSEEHKPECHYTQLRGEKINITNFDLPHPNYQCITPLRCLYQRDHNPEVWSKILKLQSHCDERRGTEKWEGDKKMVVEVIWKLFKLEGVFSENEIMRCCGILQINGHEVPLTEPEHVALYEKVSMVEHNCRANCNKSFTAEGEILVCAGADIKSGSHISVCYTDPAWGTEARRHHVADTWGLVCAGADIKSGSHISVCYTDPAWGTEARRHHVADTWLFECSCSRCRDVTECDTMYSALKCRKRDCKGYLLPETFIVPILHKTTNPDPEKRNLDDKFWFCGECKDQVSDAIIQQLLQDIGRELSVMPKVDPDACERFINHCSAYLHPNHYYMTDVSMALANMLGAEQGSAQGLPGLSEDRLQLKIQLCSKLSELMETLAPAECRSRGALLFELHAALAETGRRRSLVEGPAVLLGYITEARKVLVKSAWLLHHEPEILPEGKLYVAAKRNLRDIDTLIDNLSQSLPSPL